MADELGLKLIAVGLDVLPDAIALLRHAFQKQHPTEPPPTDVQVLEAYNSLVTDTLAHDAAYLATHPPTP